MCIESLVLLMYFLWRKSLAWFLKTSFNAASARPKYFLHGLQGDHTTLLCTNLETQKSRDLHFDVLIGYSDGAEVCKLLEIFIFNKLNSILIKNRIILYLNDGIDVFDNLSGPKIRKC